MKTVIVLLVTLALLSRHTSHQADAAAAGNEVHSHQELQAGGRKLAGGFSLNIGHNNRDNGNGCSNSNCPPPAPCSPGDSNGISIGGRRLKGGLHIGNNNCGDNGEGHGLNIDGRRRVT